jgi:hypothetical protein
MASFKVTDLMIKVLPQGPACLLGPSGGCGPCTDGQSGCGCTQGSCGCSCTAGCTCSCSGGCTGVSCDPCTQGCTCSVGCSSPTCGCSVCSGQGSCGASCGPTCGHPTLIELAGVTQAPEDRLTGLAALKEQLKRQLADVEKQHSATEESLRPQTVAQVDQLQSKLEAALEELKARRTELAQKEQKPPSP